MHNADSEAGAVLARIWIELQVANQAAFTYRRVFSVGNL